MNAEQRIYHHYLRRLNTNDSTTTPDVNMNNWFTENSSGDLAFSCFIAVIVSLIALFYLACFIQCVKLIFCPGRERVDLFDTRENRKFNLSVRQRRAVLEAFFSTKAVDLNEFQRKSSYKVAKKAESSEVAFGNKENEQISDHEMKSKSGVVVYMDDNEVMRGLALPSVDQDNDQPKTPEKSDDEDGELTFLLKAAKPLLRLSTPATQETELESTDTSSVIDIKPPPDTDCDLYEPLAPVPDEKVGVAKSGWWNPFSRKKPVEDDVSSADENQSSINSAAQSDSQTLEDDTGTVHSEEEIICAICLCPYEQDELIIHSKRCSHLFHKDCILEWLEKNDVCPCCRVDMITSEEINAKAPDIMGKERLGRAIALTS